MSNIIDFLASELHFALHLAPVYLQLPERVRGQFYTPVSVAQYVKNKGITPRIFQNTSELIFHFRLNKSIVVVSSWGDIKRVRQSNRPQILLEHGSGQTYSSRHVSYAGGHGRENVRLFICPNRLVVQQNQHNYPNTKTVIVGCPKMDEFYMMEPKPIGNPPVVAVSFHWDCNVCPETQSSFPYFEKAVLELAKTYKVLGHSHPRLWERIAPWYKSHGIERVWNFEDILRRADVYCVDNSSTLFEFASIGRPVVVLNAPWYRREIEHGMRFWKYADVGINCNRPEDLIKCVRVALEDTVELQKRRGEINDILYPIRDGSSAQRAAEAMTALFPNRRV